MKQMRLSIVAGCLFVVLALVASAESPIHLNSRLRLGYDDNVYQAGTATLLDGTVVNHDAQDSFRVIEELEMLVNFNFQRTYLGLRYRPSAIWYSDRKEDSTDFLNDLDLNFIQNFSPILQLSISDTLRASQLPELQEDNYVVRGMDDNYYNSALSTLAFNLRPETRLDLSARCITLTYDSDSPAKDNGDYYSLVGGLTLRQQLASRTTVMGDLRYQTVVYNEADTEHNRDAESYFVGVGAEQTFNPKLTGSLRAGGEQRMYDAADYDDNTQPYFDLSMTFLPTPATRFTGAASYSIYESDVANYLSQNRTYLSLSLAHDFTAKLSFYISGAYSLNSYEADYALDSALQDEDENSYLISTRLAYRINRINWLEVGYQYVKLDSDIPGRENYDRNRADIGWKIQLF